jgi:hypothetical protein
MATYKCALHGLDKGWLGVSAKELTRLGQAMSEGAQDGFRLHSIQNVPVFGKFSGDQKGQALLIVWEKPDPA